MTKYPYRRYRQDLDRGISFTMPDGRTGTLIAQASPLTWIVLFSDSTSSVVADDLILSQLNQELS
jgi:hypothetical protein